MMSLQKQVEVNLSAQLELFSTLLATAEEKGGLLVDAKNADEASRLREMVRQESLALSRIEELEKERKVVFGEKTLKELFDLNAEENASIRKLQEDLSDVGGRLRKQNMLNQEALKFSQRLVNKLLKAVQDLGTNTDVTYSRLRRRPGKSFGRSFNLSV